MKTLVKKLYEGLFLVDSALAASDWEGLLGTIRTILEKAEAEIVSIKKWDECRLAYEIKGVSRGTYILVHFNVDGRRIREIERDVQLSEQVMRVLILTTEKMEQQDIEKDTPAERIEKRREPVQAERSTAPSPPDGGQLKTEEKGPSEAAVEQSEQKQPAEQETEPVQLQEAKPEVKGPVEQIEEAEPEVKGPVEQIEEAEPEVKSPVEQVEEAEPEVKGPVEQIEEAEPEVKGPVEQIEEAEPEVKSPVEQVEEAEPEVKSPVEQVEEAEPEVKSPVEQVEEPPSP